MLPWASDRPSLLSFDISLYKALIEPLFHCTGDQSRTHEFTFSPMPADFSIGPPTRANPLN